MKKIYALASFLCLTLTNVIAQQKERPLLGCSTNETAIVQGFPESTAFCGGCNFWGAGIVPYVFDGNVNSSQKNAMLEAMATIEALAKIDFVPRDNQINRLRILDSDENSSSSIGMIWGETKIRINNWDNEMIIIHELAHALGFFHEQSRPDRDKYVQIIHDNICESYEHNFDIKNVGVTSNIPYDFESIMHYRRYAFSKCQDANNDCSDGCEGEGYAGPTIMLKTGYEQWENIIGQRVHLSYSDTLMFSFIYPYDHYRFFNTSHPKEEDGTSLYAPFKSFNPVKFASNAIPVNSEVWIMPGEYNTAKGSYLKPCVLRAPYGKVVLK